MGNDTRFKNFISLRFHPELRSDNKNNVMKLNRFLANPFSIGVFLLLFNCGAIGLVSFVINLVSKIPGMIKGQFDNTIELSDFLPHFSGEVVKIIYLFGVAFLAFLNIKLIWKLKISYSESDINKNTGGSMRWTTISEIDKQFKKIPMRPSKDENGVKVTNYYKGKSGTIISRWRENMYISTQLVNNLYIGTTRSGKGEMYVFPTIDIVSRAKDIKDRASMVIFDPKLELYKSSYNTLVERGYKVRLINLDNPSKSAGYNPLSIAVNHYKRGDEEKAQQAAKTFSFGVFNAGNDTQEPIWKNTATDLFTALIIANITDCLELDEVLNYKRRIALQRKKENYRELDDELKDLADDIWHEADKERKDDEDIFLRGYINCIPEDVEFYPVHPNEKNINCFSVINFFKELCDRASVTTGDDTKAMEKKAETLLDDYFNSRPKLDFASSLYSTVKSAGDRTKGSIFVNMQSALTMFSLNNIAKMTAENDIDFEELGYGDEPVAIFMGIPSEDRSNHFLATTFVAQVYQYLFQISKMRSGKLDRNIRFILDEFGNMPVIENFAGFVTVCLGMGISFDIFLQSYSQLETKYGEDTDTIKDNCGNHIYILASGNDTPTEFSEVLDNKTVIDVQRTGTRLGLGKTYMENSKEVPLMFPGDLKVLKEGESVLARNRRLDLAGASVKSYPIINEYLDDLGIITKINLVFRIFKKRVCNRDVEFDKDTDSKMSFNQEYEKEKSRLKRYLGTAFLYRYQYMTGDFPNPDEIEFLDVCFESRDDIDYQNRVNDPDQIANRLAEYYKQKTLSEYDGKKDKGLNKKLKDIRLYERFYNLMADRFGDDFLDILNLSGEMNLSDVFTVINSLTVEDSFKSNIKAVLYK